MDTIWTDARIQRIRDTITQDYLDRLTARLIEVYRSKRYRTLREFGTALFPDLPVDEPENRLFVRLVKHFHPDRVAAVRSELAVAVRDRNTAVLEFYERLVDVGSVAVRREPPRHSRHHAEEPSAEDLYEEYAFERDDFGFDTTTYADDDYANDEFDDEGGDAGSSDSVSVGEDETEFAFDFLSAVKADHLGNLDIELTPADLSYLEGELILASYELSDLSGLEYCVNLASLDLSNNQIDNIYEVQFLVHLQQLFLGDNLITDLSPLANLAELEILDLSNNEIEEADALLTLSALRFVDLRGNSGVASWVARELEARGVVVLS